MKKIILVIFFLMAMGLVSVVHAKPDHILWADLEGGYQWGSVGNFWDPNRISEDGLWNQVFVGTGYFEDLYYHVPGYLEGDPAYDPSVKSSIQSIWGSSEPMPVGIKIEFRKAGETEPTWVWVAEEGKNTPQDFLKWWNEEGPGKEGYEIEQYLGPCREEMLEEMARTASSPISSAKETSRIVMRELAMPPAKTKKEEKKEAELKAVRTPRVFAGYLRYENARYHNPDNYGDIAGFLLGMAWDIDNFSVGFIVPYDYMDFDGWDAHRLGTIIFGQYNHPLSENLSLRFTVNGNYMNMNVLNADAVNTFGAGVSTSLTYDTDIFVPSVAVSYQYSNDIDVETKYDHQHLIKVGGNIGLRMGDNAVFNVFGIWNYDAADYDYEIFDDNFADVGIEMGYNVTETFYLSAGYKKVVAFKDFNSDMVFLGTTLIF